MADEPARGLRQGEPGEGQQEEQRGGADHEQAAPADGILEGEGEQGGHDAAGGDTGVDDRVEEVAAVGGGELRDDGAAGGDDHADAEAGDEAQEAEHEDRGRQGGEAHADGEPRDGGEHDLAAADAVADGSGGQGTDEDADHGPGAQGAGDGGGELADVGRVVEKRGEDGAVDDEVVAVEEDGDADNGEDEVHRAAVCRRCPGGRGGCGVHFRVLL